MPAARQRLLVDGVYVPLAELTSLGMAGLQAREDLAPLYTESAGLANFFLQAEGGKYRQAWVDYLTAIYTGRATASTLSELTGQSFAELDRRYREYLQAAGPP
jgi:hypothetical protein